MWNILNTRASKQSEHNKLLHSKSDYIGSIQQEEEYDVTSDAYLFSCLPSHHKNAFIWIVTRNIV